MKLKSNIAVSDSGFIFNPTSGSSYSVNPIGLRIIELLKSNISEGEIAEELLNEYFIDEATIEKDLYDFKVLLADYKLTEKTDEQA